MCVLLYLVLTDVCPVVFSVDPSLSWTNACPVVSSVDASLSWTDVCPVVYIEC